MRKHEVIHITGRTYMTYWIAVRVVPSQGHG